MSQPRLFDLPIAGVYPTPLDDANRLLVDWGHRLGPCNRPFHQEAFRLDVGSRPVAVAISASTVSAHAGGYDRHELVELARQAACEPWASRVMLRLWRETLAPLWPCWPVRAAISYSKNSMHTGDLYRFDGWEKFTVNGGSGGGGTYSTKRAPGDAVSGPKTGWMWRFDAVEARAALEARDE